jgi:hypothetical protein
MPTLSQDDRRRALQRSLTLPLGRLGMPSGAGTSILEDERRRVDDIVEQLRRPAALALLGGTQGTRGARVVGVREMTDSHQIELECAEPLSPAAQQLALTLAGERASLVHDAGATRVHSNNVWLLSVPHRTSVAAALAARRRLRRQLLMQLALATLALFACLYAYARYVHPCATAAPPVVAYAALLTRSPPWPPVLDWMHAALASASHGGGGVG